MTLPPVALGGLVIASAGFAVWGRTSQRELAHWIFKPVTTLLILAAPVLYAPSGPTRTWVLVALGLSLIGDVLLMFPERAFKPGLVAFLLAHLAYVYAFTLEVPLAARQLVYLVLPAAIALLILRNLWPRLSRLRIPVVFYVAAITAMAWRVLARYDSAAVPLTSWLCGFAGAGLFMLGDYLLARKRFMEQPAPYPLELGVYFGAQWCLAAALWFGWD